MRITVLSTTAGLTLTLLGAHAALGAKAAPAPGTRPIGCAAGHALPNRANLPRIRSALLCLVNRERARHGLRPLRTVRRLRTLALRHSNDMVRQRYFSHFTPAGAGLDSRLMGIGRTRGRGSTAENIAWGSNGHSTALSVFTGWMSSPAHRANILSKRFRESGIGVVVGTPKPLPRGHLGATYTQVFSGR